MFLKIFRIIFYILFIIKIFNLEELEVQLHTMDNFSQELDDSLINAEIFLNILTEMILQSQNNTTLEEI